MVDPFYTELHAIADKALRAHVREVARALDGPALDMAALEQALDSHDLHGALRALGLSQVESGFRDLMLPIYADVVHEAAVVSEEHLLTGRSVLG